MDDFTSPPEAPKSPAALDENSVLHLQAGSDSEWNTGTTDRELNAIFDSRYDGAFENLLRLLEGVLGPVIVRIGIVSGDYLLSRTENFSDPTVPEKLLMSQYPCGVAIKNRIPLDCTNAQQHDVLKRLPKMVECGAKYYGNQFLTVQGGRIVGMICTYSRDEKTLTDGERTQFERIAHATGHLIQSIFETTNTDGTLPSNVSPQPPMDFTSLFDLSPVPTAVMTYPDFNYVAANEPMSKELAVFFDQTIGTNQNDCREWVPEFHRRMEQEGSVQAFELSVKPGNGPVRHFVMDGRFLQREGTKNVLVTARDVTRERNRERKLQLILEVTNVDMGDNWFRLAAEAFAEVAKADFVVIAECNRSARIESHAVWNRGTFDDNFAIEESSEHLVSLCAGKSLAIEDSLLPAQSPLRNPGINFLQGIPIEGSSGNITGLVLLGSRQPIYFDEDTRAVCKTFTTRVATEIARLSFDRSREAELQRLSMLQKISQTISTSTDPDQVLNIAAKEIGKVFGVSRCVIHRKEEAGGFPVVAEYVKEPYAPMIGVQVPSAGNAHAEAVLAADNVIAIEDVFGDRRFAGLHGILKEFEIRSMLSARTSFEGEANGAIGLQQCGEQTRSWNDDEKSLLGTIVANIGVAIAQANLTEREKQQRLVIEQALRDAKAASKAKGEFLARMSHELRTPMNSILGFSQLLAADEELTDDHRETLKIVNRSGEHLMILINDVLEMSKIESGKQDVNLSIFSPRKLVEGLSDLFAIKADSKRLKLRTELPEVLPDYIEGDESKLRQIITNLVGNAIKFTSDGEVKLKCWYFKDGEKDDEQGVLAFSVEDSGCGMTETEQQALFTPFKQNRAGITASEGTGLGLAISKSFVELLGGEIKVESSPGIGSTFTFSVACREVHAEEENKLSIHDVHDSVPFAMDRATVSVATEISENKNSEKPTILIADDQPENRLLVVKLLGAVGYNLVEAVDGQDAIDACRSCRPDIILMDVRMPGTDGLAATRTIRKMKLQELEKQPFIVALTGNAFDEDRKLAKNAGCNDFLAKPFRIEDLLEMLAMETSEDSAHIGMPR